MSVSVSRSTMLAGVAATAAAAAAGFPRIASAQAMPLAMAGVSSDLFAEPFYAEAAGAFAKAGFTVTPASTLANAGAVATAIAGGTFQLGTGDLVSGVNAILAGVPIVLVAAGGLYIEKTDQASTILAVTTDSPIKTPKDLIGKTIGVPTLVGLSTACFKAWLPAHGVQVSQVKLVEISQPVTVPALQRGTLDAGLLSEPFVTFAKGQVRSMGSPFDVAADLSPAKQFTVSAWYANKPWFEADPARAKAAIQAIYETARWANANRDATFNVLVQKLQLDAEKAKGMERTTYATSLTPGLIQPVLTIAEQNDMFKGATPAAASLITAPK
jgi:NitT/TauT family transport system substrate-binding protein